MFYLIHTCKKFLFIFALFMICSLTNPLFSDENTNSSNIVTVECSYNEIKKNYELPLEIITFSECACRSIW